MWYASNGIAHKIEPGPARQAATIRDEEDINLQRILSGVLAGEKHGEGGDLLEDEIDFLDEDGVRIPSMMDRRSSV